MNCDCCAVICPFSTTTKSNLLSQRINCFKSDQIHDLFILCMNRLLRREVHSGSMKGSLVGEDWCLVVKGGWVYIRLLQAMMRTNIGARLCFRFAIEKKLFVYDSGVRDGTMDQVKNELHSGVRATIFGASGSSDLTQAISASPLLLNSA